MGWKIHGHGFTCILYTQCSKLPMTPSHHSQIKPPSFSLPFTQKVNYCAYFSKGVADNVAVWDFDEFFIPKGNNKNMLDLIDNSNSNGPLDPEVSGKFSEQVGPNPSWRGGPGWADQNAHPYCFLEIR